MTPFTVLSGIAAPLPLANVDTDAIMPKQYLKTIKRTGLGECVFDDMRANPDFVLNTAPYTRATILITGANFGCGSSREHAPWGLLDFGIRCVIAPSFADIFASNCVKNGILCVTLHSDAVARLTALATNPATCQLAVDLGRQAIVTRDGVEQPFEIEPSRKHLLMKGLDDIGLTLQHAEAITKFEAARIWREPWHINGSLSHD